MKTNTEETDLITIAEFREFLFNKIVPIDDIKDLRGEKIYKSLQYWRRHELLPFFQKSKRFELSFAQLIWLRILDHLREFSFTVSKTKKICDYFFKDAYEKHLATNNLLYNKTILNNKKVAGTITENEEGSLRWIENALGDDMLLYGLKYDINYLTNLINISLEVKEEAGILIFLNGEVMEHIGDHYFNHNNKNLDKKHPHIYFSLSYFLEEFIEKDELQSLLMPQLLSDDEKLVVKELRKKNVKELSIKLRDGELLRMDTMKEHVLGSDDMLKVKKTFGLGNYEEVTLITRDEKTIIFRNTKKKQFR